MSLQFSPQMVSRRPGNAPGGVGPCARRCARSSRRGGVEIDGAQVPRRSRRRRKRQTGPTAAPCTTITADLLLPLCMQVAVSMEKLPGTCFEGGGANELELRRSLWLEAGSVRQRRRAKTGPAAAPCTIITAALLSPRCMQVAVSMEKPPGTCFAGGGANGLELRRSLWLEVGSAWCQWPRGAWALVP